MTSLNKNKKIKKLLIANRGEIAVRIIKTARKMGIKTIAVYSEADANSLFVQMADEKYFIGESIPAKSYLDIDKILTVAKEHKADAVHPGYGFLAENTEFAAKLEENNILFVGPSSKSIQKMGDKIESKKIAQSSGVSVVPGFIGDVKDAGHAKEIIKDIGYPVMIKASAGGGGKGIKIVHSEDEVEDAFNSARNEARNSFKNDSVFIEKFIERPRHIEIQLVGDKHGNIICLGERECSIQRNNQKVIEEAPSPIVDTATREKMYEQSKLLAKAVEYYSAGTIEYIMDQQRNFYFLEMNTRVQVEHPVTEFVTGHDIIQLMICVAQGDKLPVTQNDVRIQGHSIECRICAEDPKMNFMPSTGRIYKYIQPKEEQYVRIDTGIQEGSEISAYYDSMIAKLITYGETRHEAIERMNKALSQYVIHGVANNIDFLEAILSVPEFGEGKLATSFIKEHFPEGFKGSPATDEIARNFIFATAIVYYLQEERLYRDMPDQVKVKKQEVEDKIGRSLVVKIDGNKYDIDILRDAEGNFSINHNNKFYFLSTSYKVGEEVLSCQLQEGHDGSEVEYFNVRVQYKTTGYILTKGGARVEAVAMNPRISKLEDLLPKIERQKKWDKLISVITGKVVGIKVEEGQEVEAGAPLIVIEAMKMENIIRADEKVKISKINKSAGDAVATGEVIMTFDFEE